MGEGIPMWNGLWKLTAMVGVIGVGLFAAYHAQQGMNRPAAIAPQDAMTDDSRLASDHLLTAGGPAADPPSNDAFDIDVTPKSSSKSRASQQNLNKTASPSIDLLKNFSDDSQPVKTAVGSKKNPAAIVATKQTKRKGVDFREDPDEFNDPSIGAAASSKTSYDEPSSDFTGKKTRSSVQQVNAVAPDDADSTLHVELAPDDADTNLNVDVDVNPFDLETPESETVTKAVNDDSDLKRTTVPKFDTSKFDNSDEPGRAKLSTDFSPDSDIPRSRRARKNAGKRVEPTATEAASFDSDSKPSEVESSSVGQAPAARESLPQLGVPERIDEPTDSAPAFVRETPPVSTPRNLPSDSLDFPSDDIVPLRSSTKRSRQTLPARLPEGSNAELLSEPPASSSEPVTRRSEFDRVTPVDMAGDGVAGDVSQRGLQQPRLTIEKVAQQQAVLEQPLIYTIIVKNTGTVDAHNIVVEDRIPKGTELLGTSPQAELSGKRLIWNHLVLKPNEEKRISIKVIPKQEGPIGSVARVYFATEVTAEIVVAAPQLDFTVKAPSEVRVGQRFDLVFNLRNVGKVDASNIIVRDLVPDFLKHEAGTDIECPIGKMAPQDVREIVLPVIAMKTGSVVNKAILTADSGLRKTLDSSIDIVGEVLVLTRTGHNCLYVERPAVFTNNIRNDGNQRADRVKIAEIVPTGMEFDSASDGGKYDPNLRTVVWLLGPLAPGIDKSVTVKYLPRETGTLPAKVTATGNAGSTAAVNMTVDVIGKPELQMETLTATGAVTVGDRITSKFQLNNMGTASANNVQLRVKLPRELKLISVNKGVNFQQKEEYILFEPISELAPRKKVAYELILEPIAEADAQIGLEISADHLTKPGRRVETIQIARDALK